MQIWDRVSHFIEKKSGCLVHVHMHMHEAPPKQSKEEVKKISLNTSTST